MPAAAGRKGCDQTDDPEHQDPDGSLDREHGRIEVHLAPDVAFAEEKPDPAASLVGDVETHPRAVWLWDGQIVRERREGSRRRVGLRSRLVEAEARICSPYDDESERRDADAPHDSSRYPVSQRAVHTPSPQGGQPNDRRHEDERRVLGRERYAEGETCRDDPHRAPVRGAPQEPHRCQCGARDRDIVRDEAAVGDQIRRQCGNRKREKRPRVAE